MKLSGRIFLCLVILSLPLTLSAKSLALVAAESISSKSISDEAYWSIQTSVLTKHFNPKPEHNNHQELIGIERNSRNRYLWGGATFLNSFDQRSYYIYVGKRFDFANTPFYSKLTAGFIHGYKGEYRDKIPFNNLGIAPVILPSVGIKFKKVQAEAILLGANAMTITVGIKI